MHALREEEPRCTFVGTEEHFCLDRVQILMQMTSTESLEQSSFLTAPRFELFRGRGDPTLCGRELCDGLDWSTGNETRKRAVATLTKEGVRGDDRRTDHGENSTK